MKFRPQAGRPSPQPADLRLVCRVLLALVVLAAFVIGIHLSA